MARYRVYYMKPDFFREGTGGFEWLEKQGLLPSIGTLHKTHIQVTATDAKDPDELYQKMQGEVWSPNGEAREVLQKLGIGHTSMTTGDIAVCEDDGKVWFCDRAGWIRL
jgi:hypothetical protein